MGDYLDSLEAQEYATKDWNANLLEGVNSSNVFTDWLHPAQVESRKLAEQLLLDRSEPLARVQGLKAAGINPLFAAGDIAKYQSSLPQHEGSKSPIGDVAEVASDVGTLLSGSGAAFMAKIAGKRVGSEILELRARAAREFAAAGLDNATTQGVLTDNSYKEQDWESRLNVQRQQFENMKAEYNNILANHELIINKAKESLTQAELNGSLKDLNDINALIAQENLRWQKELNDFRINNKLFITDSGIDGYLYGAILSGSDLSSIDTFIDVYSRYRGAVESAVSNAHYESELNSAYQRALAYSKGDFSGNPYNRIIQESADMVDRLGADIVEVNNLINGYEEAFKDGKIDKDDYLDIINELKSKRTEMQNSMDEINKYLDKQRSSFGYRSWLQDVSQDAISRGLGAYMYKSGASPNPVKGFSR